MNTQTSRAPSSIRTFYIRGKKPSDTNFTVLYQIDYATGLVKVGVAACHKNDAFVKKVGRALAFHRLISEPQFVSLSKFPSARYIDIQATLRQRQH